MKPLLSAIVISTAIASTALLAGEHVKVCKDENGKPYFSDVGCPTNTERLGTTYVPNAQGYHREWSNGDRDMLRNHERRIQDNLATRAAPVPQQSPGGEQQPISGGQQPVMTYEEARARATKDAGYQKYGHLSASQKGNVEQEMRKYNHLAPMPPEPSPSSVETQPAFQEQIHHATTANQQEFVHGRPGVTYNSIGGSTFGSDGTTYTRIGNTTFGSGGVASTRIGNSTFHSNAGTSNQIGNTLFNSDGSSVNRIGNSTFGSDGTTCNRIGSSTFCN